MDTKRVQLLFFIAILFIALCISAKKCRELVGEDASYRSRKLNCFDMSSGTLLCSVKEGMKFGVNVFAYAHGVSVRHQVIDNALSEARSHGLYTKDIDKQARKEADKAAKLARLRDKHILGPIISAGWDFVETKVSGGTVVEGFLRGGGAFFGTFGGGFLGVQRFGRFGYFVGSHLGSWVGGRIGLMVYDVVNGVHYLLMQSVQIVGSDVSKHTPTMEKSRDNKPLVVKHSDSYDEL